MNKRIFFISAFFPSFAGGAEKSIMEEFRTYTAKGFSVQALSFDIFFTEKEYNLGSVAGTNYPLRFKKLLGISRSAFLFFNRSFVKKILTKHLNEIKKSDFVITQGPYAPFIGRWCFKNNIPYHYYLRDNTNIHLFPNYALGLRRLRKHIKTLLDGIFIIQYIHENTIAIKNAQKIIANSERMAEFLFKRFGVRAHEIIYPKIEIDSRHVVINHTKQEYITLVGKDAEKGYDQLMRVAKQMPEYKFLVVHERTDTVIHGNVTYMPKEKDVTKIFELSSVIVSISRWNTAFSGRIGLEAARLGISVISNSPLLESTNQENVRVLNDVEDIQEWRRVIRSFEKKKGIFILNSDFGKANTIGARAYHIYINAPFQKTITIFCRNYKSKMIPNSLIHKVIPAGEILMKFLNIFHIYIPLSRYISINKIKNSLFQFFLLKKLKKMDLQDIDFVHSWDFIPKVYQYIKVTHPSIRIYQDVPIALPSILNKETQIKERIYQNRSLEVDQYIKNCFLYIDSYIAPSSFVQDSLEEEKIDPKKIKIVPFGVDIQLFQPKQKMLHTTIRFCFVGTVNNRKGIPYLIEAWKQVSPKNAELHLYGRIYPEVKEHIQNTAGVHIKTHGFTDIQTSLPENDIFIFPSLLEGSAKSVYEAMASGLPVITTYNAGSIVEDGKSGFIVPAGDSMALAEKIQFFIEHPEEINTMGTLARKKVLNYTWEHYGKKIVDCY